jgi:hypothetical protein
MQKKIIQLIPIHHYLGMHEPARLLELSRNNFRPHPLTRQVRGLGVFFEESFSKSETLTGFYVSYIDIILADG